MSINDDPFQSGAFVQHVQLYGFVQVTVASTNRKDVLVANEAAKALFTIETSVSNWCLSDFLVQVAGLASVATPSILNFDRTCSCKSPSSDPSNDAPGNSDDDGSGARGIWVWVGISGGLGLLLIAALLVAAVLRRRRCGPDRISCILLDPWPFFFPQPLVLNYFSPSLPLSPYSVVYAEGAPAK